MEALSPTFATLPRSAGAKPPSKAAVMPAVPAVLSVSLPLRFVVLGLVSLLLGIGLLASKPSLLASYHYNQYIIAVTHLFTLGFIMSVIMGATYQLVPVALETRLHSQRMAKWQFAFHLVGMAGMVWMFWRWDLKQVGHFASVLTVGVGLFVYNIARTLRKVPRWNVVATAIASSLVWLSLTVSFGLAITAGKCSYELADRLPATSATGALLHGLKSVGGFMAHFDAISAMHAHAHLGGVGFILLLTIGVSYRLVPMFTLGEVQSYRRAQTSLWLINAGLVGLFPAILSQSRLKFVFALVVVSGVAAYLIEIRSILRARQRRRLDWGMRYFLTALAVLGLCCGLAVVLSWPGLPLNAFTGQLENFYGFAFLIGVVSFAILGMLYKIIPFLVWYARYSPQIGKRKVPALADLYSPGLQAAGYWTFVGGLVITSAAIIAASERVMPWGCGLLLASLAIFVVNAYLILSHLVRPLPAPLMQNAPAPA